MNTEKLKEMGIYNSYKIIEFLKENDITEKEYDVLFIIGCETISEGEKGRIFIDTNQLVKITEKRHKINMKSLRGIISSLVKKGFITVMEDSINMMTYKKEITTIFPANSFLETLEELV